MIVSPSILSADFANLAKDIEMLNASNCDYIHIDVMDGVFVPNISIGFPVIDAVARLSKKPLDVHLMIVEPEKWINRVRDTGADIMNVHVEACKHLDSVVSRIRQAGMKAGVTLNPASPVVLLEDIIEAVDLVLIMSVNPGFGGQKFIPNALNKVRRLRNLIDTSSSEAIIEVDGGVNEETGMQLAEAGADMIVAGNYIFNSQEPLRRIEILKNI